MLHLNSTKRLSIDIDIILPKETDNLEYILDAIVKEQRFIKKELQHRTTQSIIKKAHYKPATQRYTKAKMTKTMFCWIFCFKK